MAETHSARRMPARRPAGPAPTVASLHDAAVSHLARYASTEAGLARVLVRRVERWVRAAREEADTAQATEAIAAQAEAARAAVREVARKLVAAGAVDDAAFAESRARRLNRAGRSRRAVAAHLASRGVGAAEVRAATPEDAQAELSAAVAFARRRRIGPFRTRDPASDEVAAKELGMLARAGFGRDVAERALRMATDDAEALVLRLRQS